MDILGFVSLVNVSVVDSSTLGSSLGLVGALSSGWEFVVGGSMCREATTRPFAVGIIMAVQNVG